MPLHDLIPAAWVRRTDAYRTLAAKAIGLQLRAGTATYICPACENLTLILRSQKRGQPRPVAECYRCGKQYRIALVDAGREASKEGS